CNRRRVRRAGAPHVSVRRLPRGSARLGPAGGRGRARAAGPARGCSTVRGVYGYLKRLARTGAAYQLAEAFAKLPALALLPVYTRELTPRDYGTAELLLTGVFLFSMVMRLAVDEAFVRLYFHDEDRERREQLARTA